MGGKRRQLHLKKTHVGEKGGGNCNSALTFIIKTLKDASCYFMHNDAYFFTNEFSSFDLFFYCSFHISFNTKRGLIWLLVDFSFFTLVHIDSKALAQDRLWSEHTKKRKEKLSRDFFSLWIAPHYPSGPSVFLCQHQRAIRHCHPCHHLHPLLLV